MMDKDEATLDDFLLKPSGGNVEIASATSSSSPLLNASNAPLNGKCRLVRSFAIKEMSPPPVITENKVGEENDLIASEKNVLSPPDSVTRPEYSQLETEIGNYATRGNSQHYFNPHHNGINIKDFLKDTINKSVKDCNLLLKLESDIISFINANAVDSIEIAESMDSQTGVVAGDTGNTLKKKHEQRNLSTLPSYKFQQMSSYQRMLLHRLAAYYSLEHNLDPTGSCVVVSINPNNVVRSENLIPLCDMLHNKNMPSTSPGSREHNVTKILRRDGVGFNYGPNDKMNSQQKQQKKSFEERNIDYYNIRKKIFHNNPMTILNSTEEINQQMDSKDKMMGKHDWQHNNAGCDNKRMMKVGSLEVDQHHSNKEPISKSYSFGGISCSNSFDTSSSSQYNPGSGNSSQSQKHHKLLNRNSTFGTSTSSIYSNSLSPASSGYKSQSFEMVTQNSTTSPSQTPPLATTPSSTQQQQQKSLQTQMINEVGNSMANCHIGNGVLWAVTDLSSVPHGAILIDPNTGKPIQNIDGTLYHYDSTNPPSIINAPQYSTATILQSPQQQMAPSVQHIQQVYYPTIPANSIYTNQPASMQLNPTNILQPFIYNEQQENLMIAQQQRLGQIEPNSQQYCGNLQQINTSQLVPMGYNVAGSPTMTSYPNQMLQIIQAGIPTTLTAFPQSPHQYNQPTLSTIINEQHPTNMAATMIAPYNNMPQLIQTRPTRYYQAAGNGIAAQPIINTTGQMCNHQQYFNRFQYMQTMPPVDVHQSTMIQHNGREELLIAGHTSNFQQTLQQSNTSVQVQPIILQSPHPPHAVNHQRNSNRHFYNSAPTSMSQYQSGHHHSSGGSGGSWRNNKIESPRQK